VYCWTTYKKKKKFLISNFRPLLNVVCFLLGNSPASEFDTPTFRNTVCSIFIGAMKIEQCSETSAYKIQTPGNCPEESIQQKTVILLSSCKGCRNTFYEIWPNLSVTKQYALNIMTACPYSCLSHPAGKSHLLSAVLYCHLRLVSFLHIFPHYLTHSTIFGKSVIEYELLVLIFSRTFVSYIS